MLLLAGKKREFDVLRWRQFIVSPQGTVAYVTTKTGAKGQDPVADIQTLRKQKLKYGSKQPDAGELRVILAFEMLGMNVDTVFGLARGEVRQAMMRNELELNHDTAETYLAILRTVKNAVPAMHVHAFSPLEVHHGATTLGVSVARFLARLRDALEPAMTA